MKLLLIISSFINIHAEVIEHDSNVVKIDGICYEKEIITTTLDSFAIAVDRVYNTIYFKHDWAGGNPTRGTKYDVDTKELKNLDLDIKFGFAFTVDQKTHTVYIGVNRGIHKYDPSNNKAEEIYTLSFNDLDALSLFFKDTLYYTVFLSEKVYTYADGNSTRFEDMKDTTADTFIIDNEDNMFYTNKTGLYSQKKGTKDAVLYREFAKHERGKGMAVDVNGKVYASLTSGLYAVDKETKSLKKLLDIEGNGIAFDRDNNMIYGEQSNLIMLKPNKDRTC